VEGKSEFEFINIIIKRFYKDKYKGIKVLYAGGDIEMQEPSLFSSSHTIQTVGRFR